MKPLFLGNHLAMDFLNTSLSPHGNAIELIADGEAFFEWLAIAGLLDMEKKQRFSLESLDAVAEEARLFREWVRDWISRWCHDPSNTYEAEFLRLNELLARAKNYPEVVPTESGTQIKERYRFDSANELIVPIAMQVALLITTEQPSLIKRCASTECTILFLDRTKAHGRLYCSMAACGNRAKVAAFRKRQQSLPSINS